MSRIIIDTNALVLLIAGLSGKNNIERHTALCDYPKQSYDLLLKILSGYAEWIVTPGILAETSNLLTKDRRTSKATMPIFRSLLINDVTQMHDCISEIHMPSKNAAVRSEFYFLALVDSGILELIDQNTALITSDFNLFIHANAQNQNCINFKKVIIDYIAASH
jgi:predicted nucleic acid-binding protein